MSVHSAAVENKRLMQSTVITVHSPNYIAIKHLACNFPPSDSYRSHLMHQNCVDDNRNIENVLYRTVCSSLLIILLSPASLFKLGSPQHV